eukprot:56268_1
MSSVVAIYRERRMKIDCYWIRDGYSEMVQQIKERFSIKHEVEIQVYDAKLDAYVSINKKHMSQIPREGTIKIVASTNAKDTNHKTIHTLDGKHHHKQIYNHEQQREVEIEPPNYTLYVIGDNRCGELGSNCYFESQQLSKSAHTKHIATIKCGNNYSIYCDYYNQNFWACGCNENGECGVNSNDKKISKLTKVTYFTDRNMRIRKVCANVSGSCTFWLTHDNMVYGNGSNQSYQLGLIKDRKNKTQPVLIDSLLSVIDIQCAQYFNVALCDHAHVVMNAWYNNNIAGAVDVPHDILCLVKRFYGINSEVYSTKHDFGAKKGKWNKIEALSEHKIVKIAAGISHCFFLCADGVVWVFGEPGCRLMYNRGKLGIGSFRYMATCIEKPRKLDTLTKNNIKIIDIKCGYDHTLALDDEHKIYSWGSNRFGERGRTSQRGTVCPTIIDSLENERVRAIECGATHSFACTFDGQYYLWGSNEYKECIASNAEPLEESVHLRSPFLINTALTKQRVGKIKHFYLGVHNTKVLAFE